MCQVKEGLNRARVLQAAVAYADRHGFEALSMRKLADDLGAGAMSLYHYVPNKQDLLHGMIEIVFSEIEPPSLQDPWKDAMRKRAHGTRAALNRHRWAVGRMEGRKQPGPDSLRSHDAMLGCLRQAGFSLELTVQAMSVQDSYIYGFALQEIDLGLGTAEEFADAAAGHGHELRADEYPYLAEVVAGHVAKVGYDPSAAFAFGLELILDALEVRLAAS